MKYAIDQFNEGKRQTLIHADHPYMDYTLCGMALEGTGRDANDEHKAARETKKKIDCPRCIQTIRHCKSIKF